MSNSCRLAVLARFRTVIVGSDNFKVILSSIIPIYLRFCGFINDFPDLSSILRIYRRLDYFRQKPQPQTTPHTYAKGGRFITPSSLLTYFVTFSLAAFQSAFRSFIISSKLSFELPIPDSIMRCLNSG